MDVAFCRAELPLTSHNRVSIISWAATVYADSGKNKPIWMVQRNSLEFLILEHTMAKKTRGRPPGKTAPETRPVGFRLPVTTLEKLERCADAFGIDVASVIKMLISAGLPSMEARALGLAEQSHYLEQLLVEHGWQLSPTKTADFAPEKRRVRGSDLDAL